MSIRAGILGMGWWGRTLVDSVQGEGVDPSDAIRFVAGTTRTPATAAEWATARAIAMEDSLDSLLARDDLDAVVIATPHSQHEAQIIAAAAAGRHVFCEKPLALDGAAAQTATDACRKAGVVLAVGFNRRFLPAFERLVDIVTDGDLGDILHVEANFCGPMGFRTGERGWRGEPAESPTGGMTGLGVHCLDAMIALCGPVAGVRALSLRQAVAGDVDDTTSVQLRFVGGQTGHLATVTATGMLYRVQVFGTGGWAEMRGVGAAPQALEVVRLEYPPRTERFEPVSLERAELECFAEAVRDGVPFRVPTGDAVHGAAVLSAIGRAAGSDREVRLD